MTRSVKLLNLYLNLCLVSLVGYVILDINPKTKTIIQYNRFIHDMRHILLWTDIDGVEGEGQKPFLKEKCDYFNCYLTKDRNLFGDTSMFDAIIFNVAHVNSEHSLPKTRSKSQKFIFFSKESSDKRPICDAKYDYFFNWTWTYKKDSELKIRFYSILNMAGEDIGASEHFSWLTNSDIKDNNAITHTQKHKAAAWFVDDCNSLSKREVFVDRLKTELKKFNLTVDVFGKCGALKCKRKSMATCYYKLKRTYYFYLALEDSFSKDYVTDTVVHAMKNNAVPVVYGGADYSKFLPPGSYIDGVELGERMVAKRMYDAITNPELYYSFFKWKSHYMFKSNPYIVDLCDLCTKVNNIQWLQFKMEYPEFREWWNPDYASSCYLESISDNEPRNFTTHSL